MLLIDANSMHLHPFLCPHLLFLSPSFLSSSPHWYHFLFGGSTFTSSSRARVSASPPRSCHQTQTDTLNWPSRLEETGLKYLHKFAEDGRKLLKHVSRRRCNLTRRNKRLLGATQRQRCQARPRGRWRYRDEERGEG